MTTSAFLLPRGILFGSRLSKNREFVLKKSSSSSSSISTASTEEGVDDVKWTETNRNNITAQQLSSPKDIQEAVIRPSRAISISKSILVPFSIETAYDAFSDFPRQAEFSPWIRQVRIVNEDANDIIPNDPSKLVRTQWSMGFRGLSIHWNAICTTMLRPYCIEWESTSGMKNYGTVTFQEEKEGIKTRSKTRVTLTMTFVAPTLVARLFRKSSALQEFVQNRMVGTTLRNFRDIITNEVMHTSPTTTIDSTNRTEQI
jgi:uncharacterized membrane protein